MGEPYSTVNSRVVRLFLVPIRVEGQRNLATYIHAGNNERNRTSYCRTPKGSQVAMLPITYNNHLRRCAEFLLNFNMFETIAGTQRGPGIKPYRIVGRTLHLF